MIYVTSDLNGITLDEFQSFLDEKLHFSDDDYLFILGDIIGNSSTAGIDIIKWISDKFNIQLILGDKEFALFSYMDGLLSKKENNNITITSDLVIDEISDAINYISLQSQSEQLDLISFLSDCPLYDSVENSEGHAYIFVHSGLGNFSKTKKLSNYKPIELTEFCPDYTNETYFCDPDITVVSGHTPTYNIDHSFAGKIFTNGYITNVCTSDGTLYSPVFLCLDNMKEYYM